MWIVRCLLLKEDIVRAAKSLTAKACYQPGLRHLGIRVEVYGQYTAITATLPPYNSQLVAGSHLSLFSKGSCQITTTGKTSKLLLRITAPKSQLQACRLAGSFTPVWCIMKLKGRLCGVLMYYVVTHLPKMGRQVGGSNLVIGTTYKLPKRHANTSGLSSSKDVLVEDKFAWATYDQASKK